MIGGYFGEAGLHIVFETLPGVPACNAVGNAQAMSSLSSSCLASQMADTTSLMRRRCRPISHQKRAGADTPDRRDLMSIANINADPSPQGHASDERQLPKYGYSVMNRYRFIE